MHESGFIQFKTGNVIDEIVNETNETNYDLFVLTSSRLNSWLRSLFSNTGKIIRNVNTKCFDPTLNVHMTAE